VVVPEEIPDVAPPADLRETFFPDPAEQAAAAVLTPTSREMMASFRRVPMRPMLLFSARRGVVRMAFVLRGP
jgi:hypothetical protein